MNSKHTPTPWEFVFDASSGNSKLWSRPECIGIIYQQGTAESSKEDADFIVRAVNNHEALLAALEQAHKRAVNGIKEANQHLFGTIGSLRFIESETQIVIEAAKKETT